MSVNKKRDIIIYHTSFYYNITAIQFEYILEINSDI